jgi:hypothetical protein
MSDRQSERKEGSSVYLPGKLTSSTLAALSKSFAERPQIQSPVLRFACLAFYMYYSKDGLNSLSDESQTVLRQSCHQSTPASEANQKLLDQAIEDIYPLDASRAIEEGAIVTAGHIDMAARHLNDSFFLLTSLLLTGGMAFLASCIAFDLHDEVVMKSQSPLVAVMMSSHIRRWEHSQLSHRELQSLSNDTVIASVTGSSFQSVVLWRAIVLMTIRHKYETEKNDFCCILSHNTEADRNRELGKRNSARRRRCLFFEFANSFKTEDDVTNLHLIDKDEDLFDVSRGRVMFAKRKSFARRPAPLNDGYQDISALLRDFHETENTMTAEAKKFRQPLIHRDDELMRKGFLRQARNDFLTLREAYKTPAEKAMEREEGVLKMKKQEEVKRKEEERFRMQSHHRRREGEMDHEASFRSLATDFERALAVMKQYTDPRELARLKIDYISEKAFAHEESTEEESFRHRTRCLNEKIYLETFSCRQIDHEEKDLLRQQTIDRLKELSAERRVVYCRNIIGRLLFEMKQSGVVVPESSIANISSWLVTAYLQRSPQCSPHARIWKHLPPHWWDIQCIIFRADRETSLLKNLIDSINHRLSDNASEKQSTNVHRGQLMSFIASEQLQVAAIAVRQREKVGFDWEEGTAIRHKVSQLHGNVNKLRNKIRQLREDLRQAEIMFAALNVNGIFESFGLSADDRSIVEALLSNVPEQQSRFGSFKKRLEYASMLLIESRRTMLRDLEDELVQAMIKKKLGDLEMHSFRDYCDRSNVWLRQFSQGKLLTIFDAYEVLQREENRNEYLRKSAVADKKLLNRLQSHLHELSQQQEFFHAEGNRLAILSEEARFEELMYSRNRKQIEERDALVDASNESRDHIERDGIHGDHDEHDDEFLRELSLDDDFPGMGSTMSHEDVCGSAPLLTAKDIAQELLPPTSPPVRPRWRNIPGLLLRDTDNHNLRINMKDHLQQLAEQEVQKASLTDQFREQVLREYWHLAQPEGMRGGPLSPVLTARSKIEKQSRPSSAENNPTIKLSSKFGFDASGVSVEDDQKNSMRLLTRTGRMWKAVGDMYWRMKADRVREIITQERLRRLDAHHALFQPKDRKLGEKAEGDMDAEVALNISPLPKRTSNMLQASKQLISTMEEISRDPRGHHTAMMHLGDEVWYHPSFAQMLKLSISFSVDEHPDRLIMQTTTISMPASRPASRPGTPRSRKPSVSGAFAPLIRRDSQSHGRKEMRKAFILPDPFVSLGLNEYSRIKASINHKAGLNPWDGVPDLDVNIIHSIVAGGNLTSHPSAMQTPAEVDSRAISAIGGSRQGTRRRSSGALSLSRGGSHGATSEHASSNSSLFSTLSGNNLTDPVDSEAKVSVRRRRSKSNEQSNKGKETAKSQSSIDRSAVSPPLSSRKRDDKSPSSSKQSSRKNSLPASRTSPVRSPASSKHSTPRRPSIKKPSKELASEAIEMLNASVSPLSSPKEATAKAIVDSSPSQTKDHFDQSESSTEITSIARADSIDTQSSEGTTTTNILDSAALHPDDKSTMHKILDEIVNDICARVEQSSGSLIQTSESIIVEEAAAETSTTSFACSLPSLEILYTQRQQLTQRQQQEELEADSRANTNMALQNTETHHIPTLAENLSQWKQWTSVDPSEQSVEPKRGKQSARRPYSFSKDISDPSLGLSLDSLMPISPSGKATVATMQSTQHTMLEPLNEKISFSDLAAATAYAPGIVSSTPGKRVVNPALASSGSEAVKDNIPVFHRPPSREDQVLRMRPDFHTSSRPGFLRAKSNPRVNAITAACLPVDEKKPSLADLVKTKLQSFRDNTFDPIVNERWLLEDDSYGPLKILSKENPKSRPHSSEDKITGDMDGKSYKQVQPPPISFQDSLSNLKQQLLEKSSQRDTTSTDRPSSARGSTDRQKSFFRVGEESSTQNTNNSIVSAIIDLDTKLPSPSSHRENSIKRMKSKRVKKAKEIVPKSFLEVLEANFKKLVDERLGIPRPPPPEQQLFKSTLAEAIRASQDSEDLSTTFEVLGVPLGDAADNNPQVNSDMMQMSAPVTRGSKKRANHRRQRSEERIVSKSLSSLPASRELPLDDLSALSVAGSHLHDEYGHLRSQGNNIVKPRLSAGIVIGSAMTPLGIVHGSEFDDGDFQSTIPTALEEDSLGMGEVIDRLSRELHRDEGIQSLAPPHSGMGSREAVNAFVQGRAVTPSFNKLRPQSSNLHESDALSSEGSYLQRNDETSTASMDIDDMWDEERDERILLQMLRHAMPPKEPQAKKIASKSKPALVKPKHSLHRNHELPPITKDKHLMVGRRVGSAASIHMKIKQKAGQLHHLTLPALRPRPDSIEAFRQSSHHS